MRPDLDKKLVESFPNLYKDRSASMKHTCMCWGFECGTGWYDILYEASDKLEKIIVELKEKNPPVKFYPLKKKFDILCLKILCWIVNKFGFLNSFSRVLRFLVDSLRPDLGVEYFPCAVQVKEKYGTLRIYMSCETQEMSEIIRDAENKSSETCETCGRPGKRNKYGWISTLCDECRGFNLEEREKEFEENEDR